jgi:hypothetical protein
MYESKGQAPLNRRQFAVRLLLHLGLAIALVVASLLIGIAGYTGFENLSFLDALLNSAMLLGGMGPVNDPVTPGGKVFASLYALYAGLVFIVTAALLLTPAVHRLLHKFHWDEKT